MNEPITPRPQLYRTDYKNLALTVAAAFLGTLLALGLLMLFGKMLVRKQLDDLAKIGPPEPRPTYQPKREPEPVAETVEVTLIESQEEKVDPESPKSGGKLDDRPRDEKGRLIKRQP